MNADRLNICLHSLASCAKSIQAHACDVTETQFEELQRLYDNLLSLQREVVFGEVPEPSPEWTKPFHGISHYGKLSTEKTWLTVTDHITSATLHIHHPGCGFSPEEKDYLTIEAAKSAGEKIMKNL